VLSFLGENAARELPQKVFEAGDIVVVAPKAETCSHTIPSLAAAIVNSRVDITKLKAELITLLSNIGIEARIEPASDPSFIEGRVGSVKILNQPAGVLGEIHPTVLSNFGIEAPCVAFSLSIDTNWLAKPRT
jgi:phenylalanyl-tRNA synthetase beta chain